VFDEEYEHLLKEYTKIEDRANSSSSLSVKMGLIIEILERNLEVKSEIYKDPALCYVFLMNNCCYIVRKTENNELGTILGDDQIQKHTAKVRQHHEKYQRSHGVLDFVKLDNNGPMQPNEVAKSMKNNLKSFNMVFEEICSIQLE